MDHKTKLETVDSPIFGKVRIADKKERKQIADVVQKRPVDVFQELNKLLNERGFCITIDALENDHSQEE